ncbi:hypothetical protein [Vibrio alginolyticus]|uniref:hypothetical protein n=1 Tax=Vibrio alginolyticus TaxID=663 RepID=UPI0037524A9E
MIEDKLKTHFDRFSANELDLCKEIEKTLGKDVSRCLVSLKHFEQTSLKEIEVISFLIEQFKPLIIEEFIDSPRENRSVLIVGKMKVHHKVEIIPQLRVENPFPKGRVWSIDLTIKLFRFIGEQYVEIGAVGIEYDGDSSHYLESGVKRAYLRDSHIATENIHIIRISPDAWKKDKGYFKKTIKKYFENKIHRTEEIQLLTVKSLNNEHSKSKPSGSSDCPVCVGGGYLALDFCPVCGGLGKVECGQSINLDDYESIECPECQKLSYLNSSCRTCIGAGYISRDKAIEIASNRA